MPLPGGLWIWKRSLAERRRRHARRSEIPLQADAAFLEELLRPAGKPKGVHTPGVGSSLMGPIRPMGPVPSREKPTGRPARPMAPEQASHPPGPAKA